MTHRGVVREQTCAPYDNTDRYGASCRALQITNLPTSYWASGKGNSPCLLLSILPGVQSDNGGNRSIQGGLRSQSQFSVDGISTTNVATNSPLTNAFPSAESLADIKVQGVERPAEFGNPGDVTTISKSGTSVLHGDLFWCPQDAALDAIPSGASSKPAKIANDFGVTVGGPVTIPRLYNGKNRTFFFGPFEGFRLPRTGVVQNSVPTHAMRQGDESYLCSAYDANSICTPDAVAAGGVQLVDPSTGQPFANSVTPQGMISSLSREILNQYPPPNRASTSTNNNCNINRPANYDSNGFDVRGDLTSARSFPCWGGSASRTSASSRPRNWRSPPARTASMCECWWSPRPTP